jgi:hypothetical protein
METRMLLRGHFIGALTLVFISIACASATADQLLAELSDLSGLTAAR